MVLTALEVSLTLLMVCSS